MRMIIGLTLLIAAPSLAAAQQTGQAQQRDATPVVELQQSIPAPAATVPAPAPPAQDLERPADAAVEAAPADASEAALQAGPESRQFWYLVGAIVVAGIILTVLL